MTPKDALIEKMARAIAEHIYKAIGMPHLVSDPRYVGEYRFEGVDLKDVARAAYEAEHEETKG